LEAVRYTVAVSRMSDEPIADVPVVLANTVVVQGDNGKLDVYVHGNKIVGLLSAQITQDGGLVLAVPPHAIRLASITDSKLPTYETKDNVIHVRFPLMREYREKWAKEETPPNTDGDAH
jgi:hypothetical protein